MTTKVHSNNDKSLLVAAVSAIMDVPFQGATNSPTSGHAVCAFDHHHKTFSYGDVGNSKRYDRNITVHVKTLTGKNVKCNIDPSKMIQDLKKTIEKQEGIASDQQRLIFGGKQMEDGAPLNECGIHNGSMLHLVLRMGKGDPIILDLSSLDPKYDYDFTNINDGNTKHRRAGVIYNRPCGWRRFAIKVSDKYENLSWLDHKNRPGEWPVSYHGTGLCDKTSMAMDGYRLTQHNTFKIDHGIYTTPDVEVAAKYAVQFLHEGTRYETILQNRVNPTTLIRLPVEQTSAGEYWISPSDQDVRPYGICIREIRKCDTKASL